MNPSDNPYAAPPAVSPIETVAVEGGAKMLNQVVVLGILQMMLGLLELLVGISLIALTYFMPSLFSEMKAMEGKKVPPDEVLLWLQVTYRGMGGLLALSAVLRILSGIRSFWFRGRVLLMVSLLGGLISSFTCYCAPFSIGLAIYGLVVVLHPSVVKAYELGGQGVPSAEIRRRLQA